MGAYTGSAFVTTEKYTVPEKSVHNAQEDSVRKAGKKIDYPLVSLSEKVDLPATGSPALHRYLQEIGQFSLLTREESDELAVRYHEENDQDAGYRLVSSNLRLVVKVAMDFQKYWMQNFMDLVQEGNVGLVKAVQKFDPFKGVKFSYYASYWIRAYILKFLMNNWRLIKIGTTQAQRKLFFSLNKEKKRLEAQGFKPEPKLIAERLNVKENEVVEMTTRMNSSEVSLESPVGSDSADEQKSYIPSNDPAVEDVVAMKEMKSKLSALLKSVKNRHNEREKMILEKRLLTDDPLTLQAISDTFGISRERIRQIEANLLKKLRKVILEEAPDILAFVGGEKKVEKMVTSS